VAHYGFGLPLVFLMLLAIGLRRRMKVRCAYRAASVLGLLTAVALVAAQPGPAVRPAPKYQEKNSVEKRIVLGTDDTVVLHNRFGNIVCLGRPGAEAQIKVELTAGGETRTDARDFLLRMTLVAEREGRRLKVRVDCPETSAATEYQSDFDLNLPARVVLQVENTYGDVTVDDMRGAVAVRNRFGSTGIHNCRAANVSSIVGDVNLTGVVENSVVDNRFGNVSARNLLGSVNITSENGALRVTGCRGVFRLNSKLGDISIASCQGRFSINCNLGRVVFEQSARAPDTVVIRSWHGGIELNLPTQASAQIAARANQGQVNCCLPGAAPTRGSDGEALNCILGSGQASFDMETSGGGIAVNAAP